MEYKQYLHKDLSGHYIYCLKNGRRILEIARDNNNDSDVTRNELRRTHIAIKVSDGEKIDHNNLPIFSIDNQPDSESSYIYARWYVTALAGGFDSHLVTKIHLCEEHIAFTVADFGEDTKQQDQTIVLLRNLPEWAILFVELEPMAGSLDALYNEPDTYVIYNTAAAEKPMRLVVEDHRNGKMVRIRELGSDENGSFEIVKEVDVADESE